LADRDRLCFCLESILATIVFYEQKPYLVGYHYFYLYLISIKFPNSVTSFSAELAAASTPATTVIAPLYSLFCKNRDLIFVDQLLIGLTSGPCCFLLWSMYFTCSKLDFEDSGDL
jgi:hypothetical protein